MSEYGDGHITPKAVAMRSQTLRVYWPARCQWCCRKPPTRIYVGLVSVTASCQECFERHLTLIWERHFLKVT